MSSAFEAIQSFFHALQALQNLVEFITIGLLLARSRLLLACCCLILAIMSSIWATLPFISSPSFGLSANFAEVLRMD